MGAMPSQSPEAKPTGKGGIAPISKDKDVIGQCVQARLMALTLLLGKLEAYSVLHTMYLPVHTFLDSDKIRNWLALSNANDKQQVNGKNIYYVRNSHCY